VAARLTAYIVAVIVAITFIAGLIVGAQRDDAGPVDVMVVNGHVYTADGKETDAEAVAIQGNKILRVGTTREIQRLRRPQTVVIDAKGGVMMPGLIERGVDLLNKAANPVTDLFPEPTRDEELAALGAATKDAHRRGVTSVQTAGSTPEELELFDQLREDENLQLRVYGAIAVRRPLDVNELDALDDIREKYEDDPLFKAGTVRVVVDESNDDLGFTAESLTRLVAELDKRGWQLTLHAIGNRALNIALDAYQRALATNPVPDRGRRHFIESETMGPVDYAPFEELGIVSMVSPGQRAWASFDEHRKGTLARDMLADLVVLSDGVVTLTIFDGRVVFQKAVETDN
jgi:predicted amidohydrolase YtcJ